MGAPNQLYSAWSRDWEFGVLAQQVITSVAASHVPLYGRRRAASAAQSARSATSVLPMRQSAEKRTKCCGARLCVRHVASAASLAFLDKVHADASIIGRRKETSEFVGRACKY